MEIKEIAKLAYTAGRSAFDKLPSRVEDSFEEWFEKDFKACYAKRNPVHEWLIEAINKTTSFHIMNNQFYSFQELHEAFKASKPNELGIQKMKQCIFTSCLFSFIKMNRLRFELKTTRHGRSIRLLQ